VWHAEGLGNGNCMPEEQKTDLSDEMVKSDGFAPLGRMIEA